MFLFIIIIFTSINDHNIFYCHLILLLALCMINWINVYFILDCVSRSPKEKRMRESRETEHRTNHDRNSTEVSFVFKE